MAASSHSSSRPSAASSSASLKRSDPSPSASTPSTLPIETLVTHTLAARRSLSSINLVVRAHNLATSARNSHEAHTILSSNVAFLQDALEDQIVLLGRLRGSLQGTYSWADRDFRKLVKMMDEMNGRLDETMGMLNETVVQKHLRPQGEEKNLGEFLDQEKVTALQGAMKKSVDELQGIQQSFDGDLLRFDDDIRSLKKMLAEIPARQPEEGDEEPNVTERLEGLISHSESMAQLLSGLTKHFDMCVTAVRTTDGAAALVRRKAAEVTQSQGPDGVSISGVIAEQEENVPDLEPKTAKDRAEMLKVMVQDAAEVDDVVQEIQDRMSDMETEFNILEEHTKASNRAYIAVLSAYALLGSIDDRLADYIAAEEDFRNCWELEKEIVFNNLEEMKSLRLFYERYSGAYNSLLLEVERRRAVDEKIRGVWKKAQDSVDKILAADETAREGFRADVGEYIPTDLWDGMGNRAMRWRVVPEEEQPEEN